jgi:hypothetical protein
VFEQADAAAKKHRYQMDVKLIDQPGSQALAAGIAAVRARAYRGSAEADP